MRGVGRRRRTGSGDAMLRQPFEREFDTVAAAIAGVIIAVETTSIPASVKPSINLRTGAEPHSRFRRLAFIRKRSLEIHECKIRVLEKRRDASKGNTPIAAARAARPTYRDIITSPPNTSRVSFTSSGAGSPLRTTESPALKRSGR